MQSHIMLQKPILDYKYNKMPNAPAPYCFKRKKTLVKTTSQRKHQKQNKRK
jgi:hypothetical protein